jgi:hypothetical protein
MKKALWIVLLVLLAAVGCAAYFASSDTGYPQAAGGPYGYGQQPYGTDLDIDYCYNYLAPFGNWINLDPYGYVWCPRHMGYRWRPYSDGHWVWTDYGWTWISDFDWGWIPFHYGRWSWDDDCGWFWVPGTLWGPAWVTWRASDLYMGWAPIPPGIEIRAGMDFGFLAFRIPSHFWIFIGASHFLDRNCRPYVLPFERNVTIVNYTTIHNNFQFRNNRFVNEGIGVDVVRRVTRRDVPRYTLRDTREPGRPRVAGGEVQIYRPSFRGDPVAKPKTFLNRDQARRELAPARIYEPRQTPPPTAPESDVRKRQAEERKLLEKSQTQERKNVDRRTAEETKRVRDAAEKARIQQDYKTKRADLEKQHQTEKQQMNERHKKDSEQVRRSAPPAKKKTPPPPKKKK